MKKTPSPQFPVGVERRKGERRVLEGSPPGRHDRRKGVESRQPEVIELDMSDSEWVALSSSPAIAPEKARS